VKKKISAFHTCNNKYQFSS